MTIEELAYFRKVHKQFFTYKPCPHETIEKYREILPDILIRSWEKSGLQNFSNGFLWSVDPDEYREIIGNFLYEEPREEVHVILRTAFGDMIFYYQEKYYHCCVVTKRHSEMGFSLEAILEMDLSEKTFLNSIFFFDIFKKAKKQLGELQEDEVYGFFPAIPLGGEMNPDNLQKVNARAHLYFLSQL